MAFAGLWEGFRWTDGTVTRSFCIITTDANVEMAELHDRMPVILELGDWPAWLGETEADPASLLHPAPDGTLRTWPVDGRVGSPRNNGAELLKPIERGRDGCRLARGAQVRTNCQERTHAMSIRRSGVARNWLQTQLTQEHVCERRRICAFGCRLPR
jgi:hypothetical protein